MSMDWWIWVVLGLALLLGEIVTPGGFYLLFFGIGAVIVGCLAGFGVAGPPWFQVILSSLLSVLTLWLFREKLLQATRRDSPDRVDTLIGETAVIMEEIPRNGVGKAEMRGSSWSARNIDEKSLTRGERCQVVRVDGLTILVRAAQN